MCLRIGWRRPSQPLKSPTTLTLVGVGGPDGEVHAGDAVDGPQVGAELLVALPVRAFAEQVQVVVGQQRREGVGIVHGRLSRPSEFTARSW